MPGPVRGEHDDGAVGERRCLEPVEDATDGVVDDLVQPDVEAAVRLVGRLLVEHLRPDLREGPLGRRAPVERVSLGGRFRDRGHRFVGRREPQELPPGAAERDVVRVDQRGDRQPRLRGRVGLERIEQRVDLVGVDLVLRETGVGGVGPVGFAPDPAAEAVAVEAVGALVGLDGFGDEVPVLVVGREPGMAADGDEVGVGDVPLAAVVRLVARGPEPVTHGGHAVGIEPAHRGVVRRLGQPVGVGDPVQRGVLAGEQRCPAGDARRRRGVVPVELEAAGAQALTSGELRPPELGELGAFVGGRVALLVGHDEQDVRSGGGHHRPPGLCGPSDGSGTRPTELAQQMPLPDERLRRRTFPAGSRNPTGGAAPGSERRDQAARPKRGSHSLTEGVSASGTAARSS